MTTINVLRSGCYVCDNDGNDVELEVGNVEVSARNAEYMISRGFAEKPSKKTKQNTNSNDKELEKVKSELVEALAKIELLKVNDKPDDNKSDKKETEPTK